MLALQSCRTEPDYVSEQTRHADTVPSAAVKFDSQVMLFVYPDKNLTDSLTTALGSDRYYSQSDFTGEMFRKARILAKKRNIPTWSGTGRYFEFTTLDGAVIELRLSAYNEPWFMVAFDGKHTPEIIDLKISPGGQTKLSFRMAGTTGVKNQPFSSLPTLIPLTGIPQSGLNFQRWKATYREPPSGC